MPAARNYSATATRTTLTEAVNGSATQIKVATLVGYPSPPFLMILEEGGSSEEVVLVTSVNGLTCTATRGYDSTSAVPHNAGVSVTHGVSAIDYRESAVHLGTGSAVHGLAGSVVGTTDLQTMDKKTFRSSDGSGPPLIVQQQTGQSTNVLEVRSSTGTPLTTVASNGKPTVPGMASTAQVTVTPESAGVSALIITGKPSQTAKHFVVRDSGLVEKMSVTAAGRVGASGVDAADGVFTTLTGTTITGGNATLTGQVSSASLAVSGGVTVGGTVNADGVQANGIGCTGQISAAVAWYNGQVVVYNGAPVPRMSAGQVTMTMSNEAVKFTTVTFPVGRFTVAPLVTVSLASAPAGSAKLVPRVVGVTNTGCSVYVYTGDQTNTTAGAFLVNWVAVQMADTAAG